MFSKIGYYLLLAFTWPMQLFPLEFHYFFSDLLYLCIFRVFGYRVKVAKRNLIMAFPEKSEKERYLILKRFYRNFTDIFIETLYFTHIDAKKNEKRLKVNNPEILEELYNKRRNIVCLAGHFGNWEFVNLYTRKIKHTLYAVYKKLNNKTFDLFFRHSRELMGGIALEMNETVRQLLSDAKNGKLFFAYLIADQRPQKKEQAHWMTFLNQDTPVLTGPEKIARKTNAAVLWIDTIRVKRGYYEINISLIAENPSETKELEITEKQMYLLSEAIKINPDQWLWTHKRWKHKRE
jgi:Kdo2-lipid IVA lauroyltransferase/acyltransferase